jgi:hypothetical protein
MYMGTDGDINGALVFTEVMHQGFFAGWQEVCCF